jgi:hypothetical protein
MGDKFFYMGLIAFNIHLIEHVMVWLQVGSSNKFQQLGDL